MIVITILMGKLLLEFFYSLYTDPITTIHKGSALIAISLTIFIILWGAIKIIPWYIFNIIAKQAEFSCERITFPEEVKTIYAQIEALDIEKKDAFLKGISPLLRKMGGG